MKLKKLICITLIAAGLSDCVSRTVEPNGTEHPNGVAYFDSQGNIHKGQPEGVSDGWMTTGAVVGGLAAVAGVALDIVALTK